MKEKVSPDVYKRLRDIEEACRKIMGYTSEGRERFDREEPIRLAIIYYISIIGLASRPIPHDQTWKHFQDKHSDINWRGWVNQRNVLAHNYDTINYNLVWKSALEIPDLYEKIGRLLFSVEIENGPS
jgi:uncharacterized protein with HEPN domain